MARVNESVDEPGAPVVAPSTSRAGGGSTTATPNCAKRVNKSLTPVG